MKKSANQRELPFSTQLSYKKEKGEKNTLPSVTVPDQTITLNEMLTRFAHGQHLDVLNRNLHYTGDDYLPDVKKMDLTEIEELQEQNIQNIKELKEQNKIYKTAAAERKAAAKQRDLEDLISEIKSRDKNINE